MLSLSSLVGADSDVLDDSQFQTLLLVNLLPPLGTSVLSPVLESLIEPMGTSTANIGLMMSLYTAPSIVMIPIAGVLADRYGRRPVLLFGILCFGGAGTAIALAPDFRTALFLRLVQGIGFAALTPIIITSIGDLYAGTREATAQGLRFTGSGVAQSISPLLAGILVAIAWQYPFLMFAVAFPIAGIVAIRFEEPIDPQADSPPSDALPFRKQLGRLWTLVSHRRAFAMVVARGTTSIIWIGFLTYNSILVVEILARSPAHAGLLASLASIGYALSATQSGRITAYFDSRLYPLVAMNVAMGGGISLVFLSTTLPVAYVGVFLMGIGFGLILSMYRSIITNLAPASLRGGLVSLAEGTGRIAATITPILMGVGTVVLTPHLGFAASVRSVGVATGVIGAGLGILCLITVRLSPPIVMDQPLSPD